jgi:hypothetical protein
VEIILSNGTTEMNGCTTTFAASAFVVAPNNGLLNKLVSSAQSLIGLDPSSDTPSCFVQFLKNTVSLVPGAPGSPIGWANLGFNCGSLWTQTLPTDMFGNLFKLGSVNFQPSYNTASHITNATFHYDGVGNMTYDGGNYLFLRFSGTAHRSQQHFVCLRCVRAGGG